MVGVLLFISLFYVPLILLQSVIGIGPVLLQWQLIGLFGSIVFSALHLCWLLVLGYSLLIYPTFSHLTVLRLRLMSAVLVTFGIAIAQFPLAPLDTVILYGNMMPFWLSHLSWAMLAANPGLVLICFFLVMIPFCLCQFLLLWIMSFVIPCLHRIVIFLHWLFAILWLWV